MSGKRLAFIYPGQGAQYVGMAKDLFDQSIHVKQLMLEAETTLQRRVTDLMFNGPAEELKDTSNAQLAIFLHEVAVTRALTEAGVQPVITAGHSVGEYAALVASNVLDYGHALWLINQRGEFMAQAGDNNPGTMAAVLGLDDDVVARICAETDGTVGIANYNCPGQVVISGETNAVNAACESLKGAGAKRCLPLAVSGAFHSPLVRDANAALGENIQRVDFRNTDIPIVTNFDGVAHTTGDKIKQNLLVQMESAVQWTKTLKTIEAFGVDELVEIGPGTVLTGLAKRITPDIPVVQLSTVEQLEAFRA